MRLKWSTALYYSNTSAGLQSISIDFKDGSGYQLITSTGVTKVYTDSTGSKPVVYKAVFSNGLTLYCHSSLTVKVTTGFSARYIDTDPYRVTININSLPGAAAYNDFQDKLQIRYSVDNPTRTNSDPALRKLRKPIIYVEGYDVSGKSGYYLLGQLRGTDLGYNLMDLIKSGGSDFDRWGEWVKLANQPGASYDFMHDLDDIAGYDLVFVNYNTMRSIQDNALMLQQVINWANSQKASIGSTEKNVVIGVSMGGLVARYCLADMTKNIGFNSTDTKILITHDSPHQGANVPLGFQYFLYNLAYTKVLGSYIKDKQEDIREFLALNDKISTQQLLKARAIVTAGDNIGISMNSFLNGSNNPYHQMVDMPESQRPYKFVATSQGSQCGKNVFEGSNVSMASQDALFTVFRIILPVFGKKYWLKTNIKSLPSSGVSTILDYTMEARIAILGFGLGWKTIREANSQNPAGFVNWDGTPGGTQSIQGRTGSGLSGGLQEAIPWPLGLAVSARAGLSLDITTDQFSFVQTTSALDAPEGTPLNTVFNYNMFGNANSRVDKFVSQEFYQDAYNISHTDYTPRNARWMYNEMENITQPISCIDVCQPGESGYQISGPDVVCTTGTYTMNALQAGTFFTWSVSGNGAVANISLNGLLTQVGSGLVNVMATIPAVPNCSPQQVITKSVKVGPPTSGTLAAQYADGMYAGLLLQEVNCLEPYLPGTYRSNITVADQVGATFSWALVDKTPGATVGIWGSLDNRNVTVSVRPQYAYVVYQLTVSNACGSYQKNYRFNASSFCAVIEEIEFTEGQRLQLSPNPTSTMSIELKGATIFGVRVKDKFGALVKTYSVSPKSGPLLLDLTNLKMDVYFIEVFDGKTWVAKKIIKQ